MATFLKDMPDATGLGISAPMAQNLNPAYGNQLFQNIQQSQAALRKKNTQDVLDRTSRFGQMGSGQQQELLQKGDQAISDSALSAAGGAATRGAELTQQGNQFNAGLQNDALNRELQKNLLSQQLASQQGQFDTERSDSRTNQMMNLLSGAGIAAMKYGMGGF